MLEDLLHILYRPITDKIEVLVATVQELQQKVDAVQTSVTAAKARITEDVAHLRELIEAGGVDEAQLEQINTSLDALQSDVDSIDPDPDFPAEEPTP